MKKQNSEQIPERALDPKMFEDSESQMFRVDRTQEIDINKVHFFNKETQIIKPGQKREVVRGTLEQEKRSYYQILAPYFKQAASTTGAFASQAGQSAYIVMKDGFWWVHNKVVNEFIPYAMNELPQIIFVRTDKKERKSFKSTDQFQLLSEEELESRRKARVVIPLDQSNPDPQFQEFLKREKFVQNYSFPIDMDEDDDQIDKHPADSLPVPSQSFPVEEEEEKHKHRQPAESFLIPSQSFQMLYQGAVQEGYKIPEKQRVVYRVKNCAIFELQGKNSIEYDLLDEIERHQKSQSGYIVIPEQAVKKSSGNPSQQGDCPLESVNISKPKIEQKVDNRQEQQQKTEKERAVDRTRRVRVQIPKENEKVKKQQERLQFA